MSRQAAKSRKLTVAGLIRALKTFPQHLPVEVADGRRAAVRYSDGADYPVGNHVRTFTGDEPFVVVIIGEGD